MKTIPVDSAVVSAPCKSYIYIAHLSPNAIEAVVTIQEKLAHHFGEEMFWFPESNSLHITIAHIITPDVAYRQAPAAMYAQVSQEANAAFGAAVEGVPPVEVRFDEVVTSNNAVFIQGHDNGSIDTIRRRFTDHFSLPEGTRTPPTIVHSTIARYLRPIDFNKLQSFIAEYCTIDVSMLVSEIQLVSEKKIFLQDYDKLERYPLGIA